MIISRPSLSIGLVLIALLLQSGCATIVKGTTQEIPIASDPSGADVLVDGALVGQTPVDVQMKRKRDHLIVIQKDNYQPKSVPVVKDVGGAVWGNLLAGGLIGWGVDATSGAQWNLNPKTISVKLEPVGDGELSTLPASDQSVFIRKLNELDDLKHEKRISDEEYGEMRMNLITTYYPEALEAGESAEMRNVSTMPSDGM